MIRPSVYGCNKGALQAFYDFFVQDTVEVDRPGTKTQENKSAKAYFKKEKVRDAVECVSCGKWRCVLYAPAKPSRATLW